MSDVNVWWLLGSGLIVMLVSLIGAITALTFSKHFFSRSLHYLVSASAGVFAGVTTLLLIESFSESAFIPSTLAFAAGILVSGLLFRFLPDWHHHHDQCCEKGHTHSKLDGRRILFGDAIHNIGDGIFLTAAFGAGTSYGLLALVGVVVHEMIQELSEFFVLRAAGLSLRKALLASLAASTTIFIGIVLALFTLQFSAALEPLLLAFTAGAFVLVITHDLIPESIHVAKNSQQRWWHVLIFILSAIMMFGLRSLVPHEHSHHPDNDHTEAHEAEAHL